MKKYSKSFILIWIAQAISIVGTSLADFGLSVWIYSKTGAITPVAISILCSVLPVMLLATFAGRIADRFNRKWIIILADTGAALVSAILVVLLVTDYFNFYLYCVIIFANTGLNFIHSNTFEASLTSLVNKEQLRGAIGLIQVTNSIDSLFVPVLAGMLYGFIGIGGLVALDLVTYLIANVIIILGIPSKTFALEKTSQVKETASLSRKERKKHDRQGFQFIFSHRGLTLLVILFAAINFFLNLASALLTPICISIGGSRMLGFIQSAGSAGILVGSLVAAMPGLKIPTMKRIQYCNLLIAFCYIGMGIFTSGIGLCIGRFLCLLIIPINNVSALSMWQRKTPKEIQGRVFAARSLIIRTFMPFAYIIVGPFTEKLLPYIGEKAKGLQSFVFKYLGSQLIDERMVFMIAGIMLLVLNLSFFRNRELRGLEELPDQVE